MGLFFFFFFFLCPASSLSSAWDWRAENAMSGLHNHKNAFHGENAQSACPKLLCNVVFCFLSFLPYQLAHNQQKSMKTVPNKSELLQQALLWRLWSFSILGAFTSVPSTFGNLDSVVYTFRCSFPLQNPCPHGLEVFLDMLKVGWALGSLICWGQPSVGLGGL